MVIIIKFTNVFQSITNLLVHYFQCIYYVGHLKFKQ